MPSIIGTLTWDACEDCIYADEGSACGSEQLIVVGDAVECALHLTKDDIRRWMGELGADCARDDS